MYPLIIMFILTFFNQIYIYSNTDSLALIANPVVNPTTGQLIQNETTNQLTTSGSDETFNIDFLTGFIALIIGVVIIGVVAGVKFLGSGLSGQAQKLIFYSAICFGLWGIFSALTYTMLASIPSFGLILWLSFTMIYMFGFFKEINMGSSGE